MIRRIPESKLWRIVKERLERKPFRYICSNPYSKNKKLQKGFITMGIGGIQADVIGVKDIGNYFQPKIEIIGVEVKPNLPNYRQRHMDQSRRASSYAHKCFLAAPREFKPEEIELAVKVGIGLFEINLDRKRLKLVLPSPDMSPDETKILRLMRALDFYRCAICGCYWNRQFAGIGYRSVHYFSEGDTIRFYKYICDRCIGKILISLTRPLKNIFTEDWKTRRLENKIKKINRNIDKLREFNEKRLKLRYGKVTREIKKIKKRLRSI